MSRQETASETAYAKINLALHVRAREADGYHRIETLFVFCRDGDEVAAELPLSFRGEGRGEGESGQKHIGGVPLSQPSPLKRRGLSIDGSFAAGLSDGPDNLVLRAATGLGKLFGFVPPSLRLTKNLPVAAGIGGGSADAAAALRLLCRFHGIDPVDGRVMALAGSLGADVPACMTGSPKRGEGRGDELVESLPLAGTPVLLVNPGVPLATGPVFRAWDGVDRGPLAEGDPLAAANAGRNDLETPALSLCPVIGDVLARLRACPGAGLVRMSGSGATCFALFGEVADRDAAAAAIRAERPGWWCLATELL